jgi:hypothetical protein
LEPPPLLKALSLSPPADPELAGLANVQRAYKLRGTGQTGEFPASDARAIIDLRELESLYEWITVERLPLDFSLTWAVGDSGLSLTLALPIAGHLALSSDLTVRQRHPSPGVIGEFGAGLATMNVPGRIAIGPANSQPGLRLQTLRVLDTAEVRLRTVTIMPRRSGLLKFFLDPVAWGRDAADWMTLGMSARFLSEATPGQVERYLLSAHAIKLRDALLGTRAAWQQVRDWLDPAGIPKWIEKGKVT